VLQAVSTKLGEVQPLYTVHYVWDLTSLRHAITYRPDGSRSVRTYVFEDRGDVVPLAQRDDDGDWVYFVTNVNGTPEELVDASGALVGRSQHTSFGAITATSGQTTDVRAPAQLEDDETGLFYNRYRYYDPHLGRYISPDPVGLDGGENVYAYGPNPIGWFDPMGWHTMTVTSNIPGVPGPDYSSGTYPSGWGRSDPHCPADLRSEARCHSERKMLRDLEAARASNGGTLAGGEVQATGEFPPCVNCHRAMQRFARDSGATIEYRWDSGHRDADGGTVFNTITYPGSTHPDGSVTFPAHSTNGPHIDDLMAGYAMSEDPSNATYGHRYDDYRASRGAYTTARDGVP
jgi:RHS repeat-associated protein